MISELTNFILQNYEWIFGGIGVSLISGMLITFSRRRHTNVLNQKSGDNSVNIQIGKYSQGESEKKK